MNDESLDNPCIWSRGNLYPFFWCKWYLVSSFQICVGGSIRWRHHDVIINHKISLVYHVISLVPVSSHILNQTSFYKTMIGTFSVPYHVTQMWVIWLKLVTWFWSRDTLVGSHDIPIYSILKCSNRTKFTCISAYTCGGSKILQQFFVQQFFCNKKKICCTRIYDPLYFCASEFRSKAIWPTADNRLKNSRAPPSGGNPRYAPHPIKSIRITR